MAGPTCYPPPGITCISWRLEIPIIASFLSICLDFFFACGGKSLGKSPRFYGFHALCIFNLLKSYRFDLTDSRIDRPWT